MAFSLTPEQEMVIHHPLGQHAKVLAVAGSGKTTTMVHRIKHLVEGMNVPASKIQVLMFNRLASVDFSYKLSKAGFSRENMPSVNTFHSFGRRFLDQLVKAGLESSPADLWVGDKEELMQFKVKHVIRELQKKKVIPEDAEVDLPRVVEAISLWKNSLIPPENAGYKDNDYLPLIYQEYEKARIEARAMTFDDMIMTCVLRLENDESLRNRFCGKYQHIIVDEYQDVNYAQERLIELLAGKDTDLMVVGDDDQTIYEWRGARPSYILRDFEGAFSDKVCREYRLSHTFRFGPVLAQCAQNAIAMNKVRKEKNLISDQPKGDTWIEIIVDRAEEGTDVNREIVDRLKDLISQGIDESDLEDEGDQSDDVDGIAHEDEEEVEQSLKGLNAIVLCRSFGQLSGIESELLRRQLPYRVVGKRPFFERNEVEALLTYLDLGIQLDMELDDDLSAKFLRVLNVPNRRLSRKVVERHLEAKKGTTSLRKTIESLCRGADPPMIYQDNIDSIEEISHWLDFVNVKVRENAMAGPVLRTMSDGIGMKKHFNSFFGEGVNSDERIAAIDGICEYATLSGLSCPAFLEHVRGLDTTLGIPEEGQLVLTTIFKTKGLEFDYVVLPECIEGRMPFVGVQDDGFRRIFDKSGKVKNPPQTDAMENERRLFYVGITRARKGVLIGTMAKGKKGIQGPGQSQNMSRFIGEMDHVQSGEVMGAMVQYLIKQDRSSERKLVAAAARHSGHKLIIDNLCEGYLKPLGEKELAEEISKKAREVRATVRTVDNTPTNQGSTRTARGIPQPPKVNPWLRRS